MLSENPPKLPPGIIEEMPPDEESRYGRDLGTSAKVTWSWLKGKFGKMPPRDEYTGEVYDGKWGRLYIEVRPFDANGQWRDNLRQEFTSSGLKDAQRYGFELMGDLPEVQGFWLEAKLDKYWTNEGSFGTKNVMELGRYERAPLSPKEQALANANAHGHQMSQWGGGPLQDRAACMKCGDEMHWVESAFGKGRADGRAAYDRKCSGDASRYATNARKRAAGLTEGDQSDNANRRRGGSGRFQRSTPCDFCGKSCAAEHFTDERACGSGDGPGFYLCGRVGCERARATVEREEGFETLKHHYDAQRSKNNAIKREGAFLDGPPGTKRELTELRRQQATVAQMLRYATEPEKVASLQAKERELQERVDRLAFPEHTPNVARYRLTVTSAQMSIVQIHCDDPAHDDEREDWWPTQVSATIIEFPLDRVDDVVALLTEAANSESDGPGGDPGAARAAQALVSKVRRMLPNMPRKRPAKTREQSFAGYGFTTDDSGTTVHRETIDTSARGDYGYDHIGDGMVRMVPSGDVVSLEEAIRRLPRLGGAGSGNRGFKLNGSDYYVWVLNHDGTPKDEGPSGPKDLESAKTYARIAATKGAHDRAVSRGLDPEGQGFEIVRVYQRGTGERLQ